MKKCRNIFIGKILIIVCLCCFFVTKGRAQITIATANCMISPNELQMDIVVTNNGKTDLRWNSTILRMVVPVGMIPPGTQTYEVNYLGGSDFPLSWPTVYPAKGFGSSYNILSHILTLTTGNTSAYKNTDCSAILVGPGQTKTIGRFSFKITSSNFLNGATADLKWHVTTGCNMYEACKPSVTAYNEASNLRTLTNSCTLIVPAP